MDNADELLDTWIYNLRRRTLPSGHLEFEAEMVTELANGTVYRFRARGPTRELALDKLAELHNPAFRRGMGFGLDVNLGAPVGACVP